MKKSKLFLLGVSIFALASCKFENITDSRASDEIILEEKINETKTYLSNQNLKKNLFGNVLQSKLKNSLVYNINENEYLVEFNESSYKIDSNGFEKISNTFNAVNTVEDAFKEEIGTKIFIKGYYSANDGGNGYFEVLSYIDIKNPDELLISNDDKTITLKYITYDSVVNVYQLGYNGLDSTLDTYINDFTGYLKYSTIYIPENTYKITNNFDAKVSNKVYCGYNATIYTDDSYSPQGYNNGCLFYVYNHIENIQINGFDCEIRVNKKLDDPMLGLLSARDVDGLEIANCKFLLPKEGKIYSGSGIMDFFTNWKNVVVRDCYL